MSPERQSAPFNILIVDDNAAFAENLADILEDLDGFEVKCTALQSAEAARAFASDQDVALALVDVHLPDDKGTALLSDIRQSSEHAQVIVITGDATIETAIAAVEGGAFSYIVKPFPPVQLLEKASLALRPLPRIGKSRARNCDDDAKSRAWPMSTRSACSASIIEVSTSPACTPNRRSAASNGAIAASGTGRSYQLLE